MKIQFYACMLLMVGSTSGLYAQRFMVGFTGGIHYTQTEVSESFTTAQFMGAEADIFKSYADPFDNPMSFRAGITTVFEFTDVLGIQFDPAFARYRFGYTKSVGWQSAEVPDRQTSLTYHYAQNLDYLELPLQIRASIPLGRVVPYIQAGGFYNILLSADRTVDTELFDQAAGSSQSFVVASANYNMEHLLNRALYGLTGGIGIAVDLPYLRIGLEGSYRYAMNNLANPGRRFADMRSADLAFDLMDDIHLRNIQISLTCLFPVNFTMGAGGDKSRVKYVVPYDMRRNR